MANSTRPDKHIPLIKDALEKADTGNGDTVYFHIDGEDKLLSIEKHTTCTLDVTKLPSAIDKVWIKVDNEYGDLTVDEWAREIWYALQHKKDADMYLSAWQDMSAQIV